MSPADQSALEFALVQAAALGTTVTAITVGPAAADKVLRDALACGAHRAVRVDTAATISSAHVADAIAAAAPARSGCGAATTRSTAAPAACRRSLPPASTLSRRWV
jgi:electron transfer flavoprotein alpha/beta subunit